MSDKIDKWVQKDPESWAKLAKNTKKKETFKNFKKKFKKGAKEDGKTNAIKHMTNAQLKKIYDASGTATKKGRNDVIDAPKEKPFEPKKVKVKRKGKTYERTFAPRWEKNTKLSLEIVSELKPRSKEYNSYVSNIVESTGRSRQAVVKKIQRTRRKK